MNHNDEFYVGWDEQAPPGIAAWMRKVVFALVLLSLGLAATLGLAQRTIGTSVFEWGQIKTFSGLLRNQPYPHLLVPRPGAHGEVETYSTYYLVRAFKFGLEEETAKRFDGQIVTLKGTLIYRGNQTMIEVVDRSISASDLHARAGKPAAADRLGQQTLIGEIVDSKCYLGVMNPGTLIPHRACAIRCISGGIPPILLVRRRDGPALHFLLVAADGSPVNKQVLDFVAEPVEITGEVERQGELLVLRADPSTYRRVER